jgi:hypothetical protein
VRSGSIAIGAYVEASRRDVPEQLGPDAMTLGFAVRVPFVAAISGGGR